MIKYKTLLALTFAGLFGVYSPTIGYAKPTSKSKTMKQSELEEKLESCIGKCMPEKNDYNLGKAVRCVESKGTKKCIKKILLREAVKIDVTFNDLAREAGIVLLYAAAEVVREAPLTPLYKSDLSCIEYKIKLMKDLSMITEDFTRLSRKAEKRFPKVVQKPEYRKAKEDFKEMVLRKKREIVEYKCE